MQKDHYTPVESEMLNPLMQVKLPSMCATVI